MSRVTPQTILQYRYRGVIYVLVVIGVWAAASIYGLFFLPITWATAPWTAAWVLLLAFLYTGLFITAHDAQHRTLAPYHPKLNDAFGRVATFLFACFSFRKLSHFHRLHHEQPASDADPDFHGGAGPKFVPWYCNFMRAYSSWRQIVGMAVSLSLLIFFLGVSPVNAFVFWALPPLLSSLQLFYFGTYVPHRPHPGGYSDANRSTSSRLPAPLSFLACYHFDYHWEHHQYPFVPWWKLPAVKRLEQQPTAKTTENEPHPAAHDRP